MRTGPPPTRSRAAPTTPPPPAAPPPPHPHNRIAVGHDHPRSTGGHLDDRPAERPQRNIERRNIERRKRRAGGAVVRTTPPEVHAECGLEATMRDGTVLRADAYRPIGDGP